MKAILIGGGRQIDISTHRRLDWANCYNVRDLGGLYTADGRVTRHGAVVRADNLSRLTLQGQEALVKYGVRTVIDLRNSFELQIDPPPFAHGAAFDGEVAYHNMPLIPEESEVAELVASASSTPDMYRHIVDGCRESIAAVMRVIAESGDGAVLIHCHAGKDRTGLISALLLALVSVPTPAIIDDYEHSNECLQPYNDEWLSAIADPEERAQQERSYRAEPEFMQAVLGYIDDTYGGVGAYLLGGGLSEAELQGLRSRMAG